MKEVMAEEHTMRVWLVVLDEKETRVVWLWLKL